MAGTVAIVLPRPQQRARRRPGVPAPAARPLPLVVLGPHGQGALAEIVHSRVNLALAAHRRPAPLCRARRRAHRPPAPQRDRGARRPAGGQPPRGRFRPIPVVLVLH
jgi:hypothetical protein